MSESFIQSLPTTAHILQQIQQSNDSSISLGIHSVQQNCLFSKIIENSAAEIDHLQRLCYQRGSEIKEHSSKSKLLQPPPIINQCEPHRGEANDNFYNAIQKYEVSRKDKFFASQNCQASLPCLQASPQQEIGKDSSRMYSQTSRYNAEKYQNFYFHEPHSTKKLLVSDKMESITVINKISTGEKIESIIHGFNGGEIDAKSGPSCQNVYHGANATSSQQSSNVNQNIQHSLTPSLMRSKLNNSINNQLASSDPARQLFNSSSNFPFFHSVTPHLTQTESATQAQPSLFMGMKFIDGQNNNIFQGTTADRDIGIYNQHVIQGRPKISESYPIPQIQNSGSQDDQRISDNEIEYKKEHLRQLLAKIHAPDLVVVKQKQKSAYLHSRSNRGSRYRGVSKNGKKWQVMIVKGIQKKYMGAIHSEYRAARLYDKYSLIIQGFSAKTNFSYTKQELSTLLEEIDELEDEDMSPLISAARSYSLFQIPQMQSTFISQPNSTVGSSYNLGQQIGFQSTQSDASRTLIQSPVEHHTLQVDKNSQAASNNPSQVNAGIDYMQRGQFSNIAQILKNDHPNFAQDIVNSNFSASTIIKKKLYISNCSQDPKNLTGGGMQNGPSNLVWRLPISAQNMSFASPHMLALTPQNSLKISLGNSNQQNDHDKIAQ